MIRLGTRGSQLALWQANWVAEMLHRAGQTVEIHIIKTTGDVNQTAALQSMAGRGVFVREIETALQTGRIDAAVHSAKDMPSSDTAGLTIAAFCERADRGMPLSRGRAAGWPICRRMRRRNQRTASHCAD